MRRFELVEGKSAKFWQAETQGATFVVEYGRLGTNGQRKEKNLGSDAAASRELEKKIAEKLREGYQEVQTGASTAAPAGAKGADAASAKLELPARIAVSSEPPTDAAVASAAAALVALCGSVGRRSYVTAHAAKRARKALRALGGADPAKHPKVAEALDRVLDLAVREDGPRLAVGRCLELLSELPTAAFERAMERWSAAKSAPSSVEWLASEVKELGDAELSFRVGELLLDREGRSMSSQAGWNRKLLLVLPHLQAQLVRQGSSPRKHLAAMDARGDSFLSDRIAQAAKMAGG